jgi:tetratricopeptide (TPR) repeat protein
MKRRALARAGFTSVVLLALVTLANSQERGPLAAAPSGTGLNRIEGHVCYPGGGRLGHQAAIKIRSASGGEMSTLTDSSGEFNFGGLREGRYYLSVDAGRDFETANEEVDVVNSAAGRGDGQAVKVQINLRYRIDEVQKAGIVDVSMAEVPQAALKLYVKAQRLAQTGEREKAIEQLKEAISVYPEFANAFNELGVQYLRLRQMAKAEEAFVTALKITPQAFAPRLNYGILLVETKKYGAGADLLRQVAVEDDSSAPAHFFLGRAFIGLSNYSEAENQLARAATLKGNEAIEAHRYLGAVYIEEHQNQRAARELETYLQLSPNVKDAPSIRKIVGELKKESFSP